jgi:Spy/CpxP family protein refolding chaperone
MKEYDFIATKGTLMKNLFLTAILAAALGGMGTPALAQPHGGSPLAMLVKIKSQLNLNTSQQQQWDMVIAQSKAAREAGRANFDQVKSALRAELAKPEPDFAAVAVLADSVRDQNAALHRQTRNAWLGLYATFTPEQKAVARDAIKAGIERMREQRALHYGAAPNN